MAESLLGKEKECVSDGQPIEPYPADIRSEWEWVNTGVREILQQQPRLTFRPEDVYAACVNGDAVLWVAPEGFLVNTAEHDEFTGEKTFFIWLAWSKKRGEQIGWKYIDFFEKTAKQYGFSQIELRTPIGALENYLIIDGWKKETVIYTRDL